MNNHHCLQELFMPTTTRLTQSTLWISRVLSGVAVVAAMAVLSACQAAATPVPTPQCVEPALTLGPSKYPIQSIARAVDGSLTLPAGKTDTAYWVESTNINYVFALSPDSNNLALKNTLKKGDPATIRWADCGTDDYVVTSIDASRPADSSVFDQSTGGLTVFIPGESLIIKGARPQVQAPETPSPTEANAVQAEISFLGNTTSPDGKSVQITVAITNTGSTTISLTTNDISLTAENAAPLAPSSVEPSLPQTIQPGTGATFAITFPYSGVKTAVLKILTFSLDYYF